MSNCFLVHLSFSCYNTLVNLKCFCWLIDQSGHYDQLSSERNLWNFKFVSLVIIWLCLPDHENVICPWESSKVCEFPWGAVTDHHSFGWLSTTEMCSLRALGRDWAPSEGPKGESFFLSSGGLRHSLAVATSFQSLPPSSCGLLFLSMHLSFLCLLEGHSSLDLGSTWTI